MFEIMIDVQDIGEDSYDFDDTVDDRDDPGVTLSVN